MGLAAFQIKLFISRIFIRRRQNVPMPFSSFVYSDPQSKLGLNTSSDVGYRQELHDLNPAQDTSIDRNVYLYVCAISPKKEA
jgi:hypothetical protein